jgi:hypothetical protein
LQFKAVALSCLYLTERDFIATLERRRDPPVSKHMARSTKIGVAAKIMVAKYGKAAAPIARQRARRSGRERDDAAAEAWRAIARSAARVLSRSKETHDIKLSELLGGNVVKPLMAADRVDREDVERLMSRAKRRGKLPSCRPMLAAKRAK